MEISFVHWLVIASVFVSASGSAAYIRGTLAGRSKPNRVSWSLWALAPLIGTAAALSAHADVWATVRVFLAGLLPLIVLLASFFNPRSFWEISRFDILCGGFSILGFICWIAAGSPQLAILFLAIADGFASLPTIIKAWKFPETETGVTYLASLFAVLIVLPSIPVWNIENAAFQIYLLVVNIALVLSIYRKKLF